LPELRQALDAKTAKIEAIVPGESRRATGEVTMIDNTVDAATGMVTIRATMDNKEQILWPGALVTTQLTLRVEEAVSVPTVAVQVSQTGTYVFVVKDGVAAVRPVAVSRSIEHTSIIGSGLEGGESVVTDGQLLLTNGTKVAPREAKAGS
jgi:multidrug efflux system membrane fusion protein